MTTLHFENSSLHSTLNDQLIPVWERKRGVLTHPFKVLFLALQIRSERRQLQGLSDQELADAGLNREDAEREATRAFFDIPEERTVAMYL